MYAAFHSCGNCDEEYMVLKSWWKKLRQGGPAIFSISLEMLSSPVALPVETVESAQMLVLISVWVMGFSQSSEVWVGVGGFSLKYWEHEN